MRSTSVRAPSPGATSNGSSGQYSVNSFTMPTRDSRPPLDGGRASSHPAQMQGVVLGQGWPDRYSNSVDNSATDPYHHIFDTEMSSESANESIGISGNPTASGSQQAGSHTSYSPHTDDSHFDGGTAHGGAPGVRQVPYYAAATATPNQFQHYTTADNFPAQHSTSGTDYVMPGMPAEWGMDGSTPAMGDQTWAALDAMGWSDSGSMAVPMEGWRGMHADINSIAQ